MRARLAALCALLLVIGVGAASAEPKSPSESSEADPAVQAEIRKLQRTVELYYPRGAYWNCHQAYKRLRELGDDDPLTLYRLAYSAYQMRYRDEAIGYFKEAAAAYGELTESRKATLDQFYYLASSHSYAQDADAAKAAAEAGIERFERKVKKLDGPDLFRLSRLYAMVGKTKEADEVQERSVAAYREMETVPSDDLFYPVLMLKLARREMAGGRYPEAVAVYEELLSRNSRTPDATWELGLAKLRAGDWSGAREAWLRAIQLDPGHGSDASFAQNLAARLVEYRQKYPDGDPISIEEPFKLLDQRGIETEIAKAVSKVRVALQARQQEAAAAGGPPSEEITSTSVAQAAVDRAEAELAAVMLAYLVRGYPLREVAHGQGLVGWIFAPSRK